MTLFLIENLEIAIVAFISVGLSNLFYFSLGSPRTGALNGDVDTQMILGGLGARMLEAYGRYSRQHPETDFNPWKIFICIFCLSQWVGLFHFILSALAFGLSWKFILAHQAFVYLWSKLIND